MRDFHESQPNDPRSGIDPPPSRIIEIPLPEKSHEQAVIRAER
jgi:hypothetical protein